MSCINCDKIRDAIIHGKMAAAAGLTIEMFREKFGLNADEPEPEPAPLVVGEKGPEVVLLETGGQPAKKGK